MKQRTQRFHLINLADRSDVIRRINKAESDIQELLDAPVALIAYVKEEGDSEN